jgi:hypothetical protein
MSSAGFTGVEMSCSIVPRSHSRAMVSEVSSAAIRPMITAMMPGTMKLRLSRSALNHTRVRRSRAGAGATPVIRRTCSSASCWLKPVAIAAV